MLQIIYYNLNYDRSYVQSNKDFKTLCSTFCFKEHSGCPGFVRLKHTLYNVKADIPLDDDLKSPEQRLM